ncbi:MAG TPA: LuxR C-terminal-related transcriptional regulator [Gaiellaceae bacterium]
MESTSSLDIQESVLLEALSVGFVRALEALRIPAYIVDLERRIRWQNAASVELVGDLRGRPDDNVGLDPKDVGLARDAFARKLNGEAHTQVEVGVKRRDGTPMRVSVNSVPVKDRDGVMIGSFGLVQVLGEAELPAESMPSLSPREHETLTLLAAGSSTVQMAEAMGISTETVRNHVKRVLKALGARSRLEAVAKGRRAGLI